MPLENYSMLIGSVVDQQVEKNEDTPHFDIQIKVKDEFFRISVNVRSSVPPHELNYLVVQDLKHPIIEKIKKYKTGLHSLASIPDSIAIDYIRSNIIDTGAMKKLAHNVPGTNNDLNDLLLLYVKRARKCKNALIYAFGEYWPKQFKKDPVFGFTPTQGIHDIHYNQGNSEEWESQNGTFQDGCLIFHFPENNQWTGIFLAFQSQAFHTDDKTGNAIGKSEIDDNPGLKLLAIKANPSGPEKGNESVTLMNISDKEINLEGWSVCDSKKNRELLPYKIILPGETFTIKLSGKDVRLSNKGGQITLLSPALVKVDGYAYTKDQAQKQDWTILCR